MFSETSEKVHGRVERKSGRRATETGASSGDSDEPPSKEVVQQTQETGR